MKRKIYISIGITFFNDNFCLNRAFSLSLIICRFSQIEKLKPIKLSFHGHFLLYFSIYDLSITWTENECSLYRCRYQ